ncbi:MAG: PKD domain-containing protein [Candidatus Desulfofervidus sp.]|nr:PKD domain-containing protein [Candidatus Desulfofervidus sp.]
MKNDMWKKKRPRVAMLYTALFLLFVSFLTLSASASASETTVSISDTFMKPDETAVTSIMINNVSYLGAADISLAFDPSVVHVVSAANSTFDLFDAVIDNSTGSVKAVGADFGDGLYGNVKFAEVTLKAVGNHGETSALNISINVLKEAGPDETTIPAAIDNGTVFINLPPVAIAFSAHRYNNVVFDYPCQTIFNASASYDPDGDAITNYTWDFGDAHSGEGPAIEHAYSSYNWNGTGYEPFDVCLRVKDDKGLTNTTVMQVNVYIAGDANGDGEVDIGDAVWVGRHWEESCDGLSQCGDPSWTDEQADGADVNNDCVIDIGDAVIIGKNWERVAW